MELDHQGFWDFLSQAIDAFFSECEVAAQNVEEHMPWKKLGRVWHVSSKGFNGNKRPRWNLNLLERLFDLLQHSDPDGSFEWTNRQLVHFMPGSESKPWASVQTKRPEAVKLYLRGPKDAFALGEIVELGCARMLDESHADYDVIRLEFVTAEDLERGELDAFLRSHLEQRCAADVGS